MGGLSVRFWKSRKFHFRDVTLGDHKDDEGLHGSVLQPFAILSVSFGATRTFRVTNDRTHESTLIPMRHGDLLSMNGTFQQQYKHG